MKKICRNVMIALASAILLAGCSGKKDEANKEVTISYGIWDMYQEPSAKELIKVFEKENPGIKVKIELTPWNQYWTKLEAAATGGVTPDVFWMGMEHGIKYAEGGIVQPLNKYVEQDKLDLSQYDSSVVDGYTYNGKIYALPRDIDSIALWYNKKLFDQAGVKYPTNDWTWNDLRNAALEIRKKLKTIIPLGLNISGGQDGYYNFIYQTGGYVISPDMKKSGYDDPKSIEGIKIIMDGIKDGVLPSKEELSDTEIVSLFQSDKSAMFYAGSWMAGPFVNNEIIKDHIGVVVMPLIKERKTMAHGIGLMMSANTKYPEASWKFMKFLVSEYAQKYLAEHQVVIPALKSVQKYWAESFGKFDVTPHITELSYSVTLPHSKNSAKWIEAEKEFFSKVWLGKTTPEEGMKELAAKMNTYLSQE